MAAPQNGREFLELLRKSQLLSAGLLNELQPQLDKYAQDEPLRVAKTLIKNQLLTTYQAKNLLAGRYQGMYVGKYRILDLLGRGGMGKVYLAEQLSMERLVAVKVISQPNRKDREAEQLARFKREAKAVAALNHPNIVRAYDFDESSGSPYIVMEYVEGIDLATLVAKAGPLTPEFAADIMRQAVAGLHDAHRAGMVHRDIKPGNLLIDAQGRVRILDLGLCALQSSNDDSLTVDQNQLGTVDYIAPEQAVNSHNVDHRADLFSLGATIYSALRGNILFPGYTTAQKLIAQQSEDPQDIRELVPGIPEGFAALLHGTLAKAPGDRPESAAVLYRDLKQWAKRPQPPFDPELIPTQKKNYEGLLGKGPDASDLKAVDDVPLAEASTTATASSSSMAVNPSGLFQDFGSEEFAVNSKMTALQMPTQKPKRGKRRSKKKSSIHPMVYVGGGAAVLLLSTVLITNSLFSSTDPATNNGANTATDAPPNSAVGTPVAEWNAHISPASTVPISIRLAANACTAQPIFYEKERERLLMDNWEMRTVNNVQFDFINPLPDNRPNVILLYANNGDLPPKKPKSVELACNQQARSIHLLSGIGGWAYPMTQDRGEVMTVRLHYENGETEDHPLLNGDHFVDYIKRVDVTKSNFAFMMGEHQMRQISIQPGKQDTIKTIEFIKGPLDAVCPVIMAVSIELP
ncbi:MAG: serine/threonine protein kinase [Planctomycetaceae bacterium]|nr:serine/threonine protein kinase [Planctomycetaceae bacterium]